MDVFAAFESRTSRRAFLQRQVDRGTLEKIVNSANRSPSYMNTQPWELYVLAGEEKHKLATKLSSDITNGVPLIDEVIAAYRNNFKFFDAPCVIFVAMDRTLTPWSIFDCGSFVSGFLLAAHAEGLDACPQAVPTGYAGAIRSQFAIPDHLMIVICISLGYPDLASPVNQYHSLRRELAEFVHWYGFSGR